MIKDQITTTRENVIEMVSCRNDYGHNNQICDHFFWTLLGERLSDEEIKEYANSLLDCGQGYTEKDYEEIVADLPEWVRTQKGRQNGK